MELKVARCPSCGSTLDIGTITSSQVKCNFCGSWVKNESDDFDVHPKVLFDLGLYCECEERCKTILGKNPNDPAGYLLKGLSKLFAKIPDYYWIDGVLKCFLRDDTTPTGEMREIINSLKMALKIDRKNGEILSSILLAHYKQRPYIQFYNNADIISNLVALDRLTDSLQVSKELNDFIEKIRLKLNAI